MEILLVYIPKKTALINDWKVLMVKIHPTWRYKERKTFGVG